MAKPIVLVTRKLPPAVEARCQDLFQGRFNAVDRKYTREEIVALAEAASALVVCPADTIDAALINALPDSVRFIATFSVGFEHIDLVAAEKRGILVSNTPDVLTDATADLTWLLLLGAARRASEGERLIRAGTWEGWAPTQLLGTQVTGATLGIVGMGRIGRAVARRATAFGMNVVYHGPRRLTLDLEGTARYYANAYAMLPLCDFLSLHCPSKPETKRWLNAERLRLLPQGSIVVNTARGDLIDDEALLAALTTDHVKAAGLDVFVNEPHLHEGYRGLANTFLLPHLGSATTATRNAMGFCVLKNLEAYFSGNEPPDRVKGSAASPRQ